MILICDNDIVIKLVGCELFDHMLMMLSATRKDILITPTARFSIQKYAKKQITNETVRDSLVALVNGLATVSDQDHQQLAHLSSFDGLDGGENQLILAAVNMPHSTFLTGDKRCLSALVDNSDDKQISTITKQLANRIYCFEHILLQLIDCFGFDVVKNKVLNRCVKDGMLDIVFRVGKTENDVKDGLWSFGQLSKFSPLLAQPNKPAKAHAVLTTLMANYSQEQLQALADIEI
ncbi:hypothetical protein ACFBZI_12060 [Moraxella sp. ZJ142]|uniref:hypothetical protein n=1 Tax=Moraxella marmotae TaxID=3344520 RepID=UPI0035D4A338